MIVTCTASMYVYMHAGVTRNVPELGIDGNDVHRNMHAQYVNIPYSWDNAADKMNRVEEADFVFYGVNSWGISNWITQNVDSNKLYIVGNKKFGNSNGIIYINRNQPPTTISILVRTAGI